MNRPLFLRFLPDRLRLSAWARLFQPTDKRWHGLYQGASLRHAPGVVMDLLPGDVISDCIAFTGIWELSLTRHLLMLARRGGTMIEVGANLGYFSLLWAAARAQNRCFAFEASPRNLEYLKRNLTRNGFDSQVSVFSQAAGKEVGILPFVLGPAEQTGWGGFAPRSDESTIEVEVVRVDETLRSIGVIDLLKIDIEGADTWALLGCEGLLRERRIKSIWFEQNKPRMRELGIRETEAEDFLRSLGYRATPATDPREDVVNWSAIPSP